MKTRDDTIVERGFRWARAALGKPLPETAPPGFATRVLARLRQREPSVWELLAVRALPVAAAVAITFIFTFVRTEPPPDDAQLADFVVASQLEP